MKNSLLQILSVLAVLAIGTSGIILYQAGKNEGEVKGTTTSLSTSSEIQAGFTLSVKISYDEKISDYEVEYTENETLFDVLNRLDNASDDFSFKYEESSFGVFITAVNDRLADSSKNEFWNLKINGQDSQMGVSDYKLQKNDSVQLLIAKF